MHTCTLKLIHTVYALVFVCYVNNQLYSCPSELLHWNLGNRMTDPRPMKQPCWVWIRRSYESTKRDYVIVTKRQNHNKTFRIFYGTWCIVLGYTWWRLQMETFSVLLALCEGNLPVTAWFPSQRPETRSFDVFFDVRLNRLLYKQSRRRWFETPSCPLWRHSNDMSIQDPALMRDLLVIGFSGESLFQIELPIILT